MAGFRLILALHTPLILPIVPPTLETLLQEGMRRLHQDWDTVHELPLVKEAEADIYRCSQVIFASTPSQPLLAQRSAIVSRPLTTKLSIASDLMSRPVEKPRVLKMDGGPNAARLTRHDAIIAPYVLFYAEGDAEATVQALSTIKAMGRESSRHYGAFSVAGVEVVDSNRWAMRNWPREFSTRASSLIDSSWIPDEQRVGVGKPMVPVVRTERVLREVLHG